jgi:hypothetical protein
MQASCNDKVPSSTNRKLTKSGCGTLGFLTTLHSYDSELYSQWTNFRGWDLPCRRITVTRVQTQFQIHLGYPQHLLLALVQE